MSGNGLLHLIINNLLTVHILHSSSYDKCWVAIETSSPSDYAVRDNSRDA